MKAITVYTQDQVFFIEANFMWHPQTRSACLYASAHQSKEAQIKWHQYWEGGVSKERTIGKGTTGEDEVFLRDQFSQLAAELEAEISKTAKEPVFIRIFNMAELGSLMKAKPDSAEAMGLQ